MSLRWSSCVTPTPPTGAQKRNSAVFCVKSHFTWRKSATKFLCVKTVSDKVVRHSLVYLSVKKNYWWGRPLLCENLLDADPPVCKLPIFDLFSSVATNRKSHINFRLVRKSVTLNDSERRIGRYYVYRFGSCGANCVQVAKDRPHTVCYKSAVQRI